MTTTNLTTTTATLIADSTTLVAGTPQRAAYDVRTLPGGFVHANLINGATAPTQAGRISLYANFSTGATPATGAEGTTWRLVQRRGCSLTNNARHPTTMFWPLGAQHIQIEFDNNTVQNCTVEAQIGVISNANTV